MHTSLIFALVSLSMLSAGICGEPPLARHSIPEHASGMKNSLRSTRRPRFDVCSAQLFVSQTDFCSRNSANLVAATRTCRGPLSTTSPHSLVNTHSKTR